MVFTGSGVVGTGKDLTLGELSVVFGITVERLLTVDGSKKTPQAVYRKIRPLKAAADKKDDDGLEE